MGPAAAAAGREHDPALLAAEPVGHAGGSLEVARRAVGGAIGDDQVAEVEPQIEVRRSAKRTPPPQW